MLDKILSGKSFFVQLFFGLFFLVFFSIQVHDKLCGWEGVVSATSFLLASAVLVLYSINSQLVRPNGITLWFLLFWLLTFCGIVTDYKLSLAFLFSSLLFWRFLFAQQNPEQQNIVFEIGILASITCYFYPPAAILSGLILVNYLYFQFSFRAILLYIIGFTLPLTIGVQISYLYSDLDWVLDFQSAFCFNYWTDFIPGLIPVGLLILFSWIDHLAHSAIQDINKRQLYFFTFWYFIIWLIIMALFGGTNKNLLIFVALPVTIFLSRFTQYQSSDVLKNLILWLYLISMVTCYFQDQLTTLFQDLLGNVAF